MELKNFQYETVLKLKDAMNASVQNVVLKSPTGSGKTLMLTYFMNDFCRSFPKTVFVWLTPGKGNLEEQSKKKMDMYFPNANTKLIGDVMTTGFEENDCCFINWEMLTKSGNNALKEGERKNFKEHIETALENGLVFKVIVDESHQNDSIKAKEIIDLFGADKIIRASATPKNVTDATLIEVKEEDVIAEGLIKKLLIVNEDIQQKENVKNEIEFLLEKAVAKQNALRNEYLKIHAYINPLIVVQIPNKNDVLLEQVERYFESKEISYENGSLAVWISEKKENLDGIENLNAPPIAVIIKQAIATGWDCPRAHILVKLRDNMSETFEIQTIGRIRRMPEAMHYENDLLDNCYLYTFDEKFTEEARRELGEGALNAAKLYLKPEFRNFTLKGEYKTDLENVPRDGRLAIEAIAEHFQKIYKVSKSVKENLKILEAHGYAFSENIVKHTVSGEVRLTQKSDFDKLNKLDYITKLDTHEHGRMFHHELSNIGLKIGLPYDQMNLIIRRLFGKESSFSKKILSLEIKQLYAFVLNNSDKLRFDIVDSMSDYLTQIQMPNPDKITTFDFTIPRDFLFTYNGKAKAPKTSKKNVYEGYLNSAAPRSAPEKLFEKYLEKSNSVKWFYKNGDKGSEYFSIVYRDNFGKLKSFYPDYIIETTDGKTWIIETKGGFKASGNSEDIDKFSKFKFEALKIYLAKHNLKGGFVRQNKNDMDLYICTENYSDDIGSNDWKSLEDVLG
jgi:type III restriction enzyme